MPDRDTKRPENAPAGARREEIERSLGGAENRYRALIERAPAVTYVDAIDEVCSTVYISPQVESMLGYAPEEWLATPGLFVELLHPEDVEWVLAENDRTVETGEPFRMEYRMIARDGRTVWVRDEAVLVRDEEGSPLYWQGVMTDVTGRKGLDSRVVYLAYHDPLTGLSNRSLFREQIDGALSRAERRGDHLAILNLDLDGFKQVNDAFGHEAGDRLLVAVARRLESSSRYGGDAVARLGGDEFCVLLEDVAGPEEALRVAERARKNLHEPFAIDHRTFSMGVSIGIAMKGPGENKTAEQLLRESDAAMYRAKKKGKNRCQVFESGVNTPILGDRARLESDLRRAIREAGFSLYYQPTVSFETDRIVGMEALVRWAHPEGRLAEATEFVSLAEDTGMIVPLGRWVLREACRQAKEWRCSGSPNLIMNVNFSAHQFDHPTLVDEVAGILDETGLDPGGLCVEITETAAMKDAPSTVAVLRELKSLGVRLAIDDFGVGHSSLSYLKRFPVDALKIDRSLIEGLNGDGGNTAIVAAAIAMAHALGLEAVAEGVETESEADELRALGCDLGQGHYWWTPHPPHLATTLLETNLAT